MGFEKDANGCTTCTCKRKSPSPNVRLSVQSFTSHPILVFPHENDIPICTNLIGYPVKKSQNIIDVEINHIVDSTWFLFEERHEIVKQSCDVISVYLSDLEKKPHSIVIEVVVWGDVLLVH